MKIKTGILLVVISGLILAFFYVDKESNELTKSVLNPVLSAKNDKESDTLVKNVEQIPTSSKEEDQIQMPQRETNGRMAYDNGLKVWNWESISLPNYKGELGASFSNGELHIDSECYEKQVAKVGGKLRFRVDPKFPEVDDWCPRDYNMRAEIRTAPWNVRHPLGTEEWFGWSYYFGDNYTIDQFNDWLFFQVHHGIMGDSPQIELMISKEGQNNTKNAGEICVVNKGNYPDNHPTGITPKAGDELKIVVHAVWGTSSNGLLQVWINDNIVYDKKVATVYKKYPWGGNAKWGIYKWPWANKNEVDTSIEQGITHLETYMGPLKVITRKPGDAEYLSDSYSMVVPD